MVQFALISLIPNLLRRLEDSADPDFDSYERSFVKPTTLKTSERHSCEHCSIRDEELQLIEHSAGLYGPSSSAVGEVFLLG